MESRIVYMLRTIILSEGYSLCERSTLWVYFFSQICVITIEWILILGVQYFDRQCISFFSVAYRINELYYVWSRPDNAVSYEGKLELSQFDIMETAYRSLNYSRGYNSKSFIHFRGRTQGGSSSIYFFRYEAYALTGFVLGLWNRFYSKGVFCRWKEEKKKKKKKESGGGGGGKGTWYAHTHTHTYTHTHTHLVLFPITTKDSPML